jgi:hypothetical protein
MCIVDYFRAKLDAMGPGERLAVDRAWIEWLLDAHSCACSAPGGEHGLPAAGSALGYTVAELAGIFGWSTSKTKTRLAAGVFGDPDLLKPEPPIWNVPPENVRDLRNKLVTGYQVTREGLRPPAGDGKRSHRGERPAAGVSGEGKAPEPDKPSRQPPRGRRSGGGRHSGWRQHVAGATGGAPI